jgi:hypothetical protein
MKTTLPILASLLLFSSQPAQADTSTQTRLLCNQSGVPVLEIQYDGPRYADSLNLTSFDGAMVTKLVSTAERTLKFSGSHLSASFNVGSCVATPTADTLLTCESTSAPTGTDWIIARYDFQHYRPVGRAGFHENVSVERDLRAEKLKLTVTRKRVYDPVLRRYYNAANLKLELSGQSPFASFSLVEERLFGELVSESELSPWERCAFVK